MACALLALWGCGVGERAFDGTRAYQHVVSQVGFGPRPPGSDALRETGDYIIRHLEQSGWVVWTQELVYRGVPIRNIFAAKAGSEDVPRILLGAHCDTRPRADREGDAGRREEAILGANDGASGVAVLLELARVFVPERSSQEVLLAFFDAEDSGNIGGWPFSVGAEVAAEELASGLKEAIVVDMVGDADQQLYFEQASDEGMRREIWAIAEDLGYARWFIPEVRYGIMDDHVPFIHRGVPSVLIIDFDYPYWHTLQDTADKVSPDSLARVGRALLEYLYRQ